MTHSLLRVLLVEDNEADARLLLRELENAGYKLEWQRVFSKADFLEALLSPYDIILSDFSMPQFDGLQALQLMKESGLDIPFILVSGTIGEDRAVNAIKAGVTDYVLKDRRSRLGEAVQRALREAQTRRERDAAEAAERDQRSFAESLARTAGALNSILKLDQMLDYLLTYLQQVLPYDFGAVLLAEGDTARVLGHRGYAERGRSGWIESLHFPLHETGTLNRMLNARQPLLLSDVQNSPDWISMDEDPGTRGFLGAPIMIEGEVIGFITLHSGEPEHFSAHHAGRLQSYADHAAIAIRNAQLVQSLEEANASLESRVRERTEELIAAKDHAEAILNATGESIVVLDAGGRILNANPAFEQFCGLPPERFEARHLNEVFYSFGNIGEMRRILDTVEGGSSWRGEVRIRRHDGERLDAAMTFTPYRAGLLSGSVCAMRDITPLKEVARLKEEFVANVSHELRTPITGLQLNLEMIERDPDQAARYYERMRRWMKRLIGLIEDLLRLSRLEHGRVALNAQPFDLAHLVRTNVDDREPMAQAAQLDVRYEGPREGLMLAGDEGLIGQVLSILLTNAFNYTPPGGSIVVRAFAADSEQPGYAAAFSVQDTGPGISTEDQPHIFERFFRGAVGQSSGKAGTGLGLSIAQRVIEEHGGRIELSSEGQPGQGARFTVWLKVKP